MTAFRSPGLPVRCLLAALLGATCLAAVPAAAREGEVRVAVGWGVATNDTRGVARGKLLGLPSVSTVDASYWEEGLGGELSGASDIDGRRWSVLAGPRLRTRPRPVSWSAGLKLGAMHLEGSTRFALAPDVGAEIELGPLLLGLRDAFLFTARSPTRSSNRVYAVLGFWF